MTGFPGVDTTLIKVAEYGELVRLGRDSDGGYVLPKNVVERATALLSLGLSNDWSFEEDFRRAKPNAVILGFDPSVSAGTFVARAAVGAARGVAHTLAGQRHRAKRAWSRVRVARDYFRFFRGKAAHHRFLISDHTSFRSRTFGDILQMIPESARGSIIVKMDIEGSEYRVLPDLLVHADAIDCLVIEFHDTDVASSAFNWLMKKLQEPFGIAHIHANNYDPLARNGFPRTVEMSFVSRRLFDADRPTVRALLRDGLDFPNNPARPDIDLSGIITA